MPTTTPPSSQQSTVSFGGSALGSLTSWKFSSGSATFQDVTNVDSTTQDSGGEVRVVKEYTVTLVDAGNVDVTLFGCPPYTLARKGEKGTLTVTFSGGSISVDAYLESFDVTGNVGQFLVGTAKFRFANA